MNLLLLDLSARINALVYALKYCRSGFSAEEIEKLMKDANEAQDALIKLNERTKDSASTKAEKTP